MVVGGEAVTLKSIEESINLVVPEMPINVTSSSSSSKTMLPFNFKTEFALLTVLPDLRLTLRILIASFLSAGLLWNH